MKQKVLITGGSGLLGLNWALQNHHRKNYILGMHSKNIEFDFPVDCCQIDMRSTAAFQSILEMQKPDYVIHTAAMTNVDDCETEPQNAYEVNVRLAGNVATACYMMGIPLVHVSSDHLFSGYEAMLDESALTQPVNVYARTKAEGEQLVIRNHPTAIIARTNFFGWGTSYRKSFSDFILDKLRSRQQVELYTNVFFTPISIPALISAIEYLIEKKSYGIYHITGDERLSKCDFGYKIARVFKLDASLIIPLQKSDKTHGTPRPLDMSISNNKICNYIGYGLGNVDSFLNDLLLQQQNGLAAKLLAIKTV